MISSAEPILSTIRLLHEDWSYAELPGLPVNQLSKRAWYPVYNNISLNSELQIANAGMGPTTIAVYAAGEEIDRFELQADHYVRKTYQKNTSPFQVLSSVAAYRQQCAHPVHDRLFLQSVRADGFAGQLTSTRYFIPWYNNTAMRSELRLAMP